MRSECRQSDLEAERNVLASRLQRLSRHLARLDPTTKGEAPMPTLTVTTKALDGLHGPRASLPAGGTTLASSAASSSVGRGASMQSVRAGAHHDWSVVGWPTPGH